VSEWTILELEPAKAARSGLPERVAVPAPIAEAHEELDRERVAGWAGSFAQEHPEHPLADVSQRLAQAEPYRRLGMQLLRVADRVPDAVKALERAVELAPFDAASRFNLGVALHRSGREDDALRQLDEAEWAYEDQPAFLAARGSLLEAMDEPDRAVVEYEKALQLAPGDEHLLDRLEALGALVRLVGPDGEPYWLAPADFERVIRHELAEMADSPDQLVARGEWLLANGHHQLARAAGDLAVNADAQHARAWALAGLARLALGEPDARPVLEQAAAADPQRLDVARALVVQADDPEGDVVRAEIHARRHAYSAAAWLVLGDILARDGDDEDAVAAYQQALALAPDLVGAGHARAAVSRAQRS
jgi:tetratricopeptide (TPR) repeat protein